MKRIPRIFLSLLAAVIGVAGLSMGTAHASTAMCGPGPWGVQQGYSSLVEPGGYHGYFEAKVHCVTNYYGAPGAPSGSRYIGVGTLNVSKVCVMQTIGGYPMYALSCSYGVYALASWYPHIWIQARVYLTNGTSYGSTPIYTG